MDRSWMSKDRMSREYEEGVEYLINFALEHCPNQSGICCPCMQCGNLIHHTPNKIREHTFFNGIDQSYHTWYWHGEAGPTSRQPTEMAQCYDTMDCGDVASTTEMVHVIDNEFMTNPISFKKLLEDAEKPLYPSCIKFTKLSALVKLYNVKARYGWSDKSFSDLLQILGDMLPVNYEMPLSMYEAKKTLNALGMEYKKIHACPNDCILYSNELNDASSCPTCGTSRWKVNKAGARNSKRIPAKVLWYFPPIPRFKRMFQSPKIVKDLKWHAKGRENNGKLRHPVDSPTWQLVNQMWPEFASDCRNFKLAISADGVKAYDAHQRAFFTLKAILLWTINDFPAYGNLSGCTVKGYHACPICGEETNSHWLKHGNKNSYIGHRRFLPCNHPFRKQKKAFNGEQEFRLPPKELTGDEIFTKVDMIHNSWGKKKKVKQCESFANPTKKNVCESIIGTVLNIPDDISKKELIENELKWLAKGPRQQVLTYPGYIINGCHYHIKERDEARVNQNSGVSIVASTMQIASSKDKNPVLGNMCFNGIVREIWDLDYNMFNICVFKCDWVDSKNSVKVDELGFTLVDLSKIGHKSDPFILATQAQQVFYVEDQVDPRWSIVLSRPKMELFDIEGDGNIADNDMEYHPFVNGMPNIKFFDEVEDYDEIWLCFVTTKCIM
ncbi:hypothetical protein CK203_089799 [Vitis vinifera]|uniref:Transposase-associated domain-containing protein n=1 Tax=Vitis vinifera TaxID=29760 RepID=A0A438BLB8_VITVI|nr:hypothetical protein CK203_089799 [Vitis vinifera]